MATFGEKLKQLRDERGLTQAELADIIGTSKQVISRYETNQRTPKITVAQEYADRLNVSLSYLIDNSENIAPRERINRMSADLTLGDRIKQRREELGLSVDYIAKRLGKHRATVYRYESNDIVTLPTDVLEPLAVVLNTTPAELMGWSEDLGPKIPPGFMPLPETERLPIIGAIACGTPITAEQNIEGYANVPTDAGADFCLTCTGDSMIDAGIYDGDIVYIRKQERVENGQIAAVRIENEATLKRFYYDGDKVTLLPANSQYAPMIFVNDEINQLHIEGLAVGFYHRL